MFCHFYTNFLASLHWFHPVRVREAFPFGCQKAVMWLGEHLQAPGGGAAGCSVLWGHGSCASPAMGAREGCWPLPCPILRGYSWLRAAGSEQRSWETKINPVTLLLYCSLPTGSFVLPGAAQCCYCFRGARASPGAALPLMPPPAHAWAVLSPLSCLVLQPQLKCGRRRM